MNVGAAFRRRFEVDPAGVWAAPGRVNIIGEHTDYNFGYALPIATPQVTRCAAARRADPVVRVASRQRSPDLVTVELEALGDNPEPGWSRYPLGVLYEFHRRFDVPGGLDLYIDGAVPMGAGLSSSAALECAVAVAVRDLYGIEVTAAEVVDITSTAENDYVGAPTGTLDQFAAMLCTGGHALLLDFGDGTWQHIPLALEPFGLELLVIDTNTAHELVSGEYARRREQCTAAAAALGAASLRDAGDLTPITDPVLRSRARHVTSENIRVLAVVAALRSGEDPRAIGPLLTASHESLRDDFEVSTPVLDAAVAAALDGGAHGARLVGGGFGGSVLALVNADSAAAVAESVAARFAAAKLRAPNIFTVTAGDGARREC
ncbi:galactokinase [Skermania sp. ID1734]|uniref:galactokinase n=1 Tax=Skermania sp. ID1734 TaxID=2597516 RepID=UPI0011814B39|nr:galactokinase [Skermania sp. ID1734]TSD97247.1 galactokinase [Skermania sp. ID1734]